MADLPVNRRVLPRNTAEAMDKIDTDAGNSPVKTPLPTQSPASGVKFFNGRPATTAQSEAKKKSMIAKLRGPAKPDFVDSERDNE